jgi:hypothetical protein
MADDMTTDFYEYFIKEEELNTKGMIDDDDFNERLLEHLNDFVTYEVNIYDVEHYVNNFGVLDAIQLKIDYDGELDMAYLDKSESNIDKNKMNRQLLFIILREIAQEGYSEIYEITRMNELLREDRKNEKIDYINQISQMIIGF